MASKFKQSDKLGWAECLCHTCLYVRSSKDICGRFWATMSRQLTRMSVCTYKRKQQYNNTIYHTATKGRIVETHLILYIPQRFLFKNLYYLWSVFGDIWSFYLTTLSQVLVFNFQRKHYSHPNDLLSCRLLTFSFICKVNGLICRIF